jgi:predicted RNA methylase
MALPFALKRACMADESFFLSVMSVADSQFSIANATMRGVIEKVCRDAGYDPARICTPTDLWGN